MILEKRLSPVLVVGDRSLTWQLGVDADQVTCVPNYMDALGELTVGDFQAVVGRVGPMRQDQQATIAAMRRVAPDARLLLVAAPAEEPDAMRAVRLGMDNYLVEPLRRGELAKHLTSMVHARLAKAPKDEAPAVVEDAPTPIEPTAPTAPAPTRDDLTVQLMEQLLSERGSMCDTIMQHLRQIVGQQLVWTAEPDLDAHACVPITHKDDCLGYLVSDAHGDQELIEHADWAAKWLAAERRIVELKRLAMRDELTGAWNRRYFQQFFESILRRAHEQQFQVTLLIFDIDDFKRYNDEFGHAAGDEILREAVRLMQTVVRRHDVVARIGGDEFAVIFWDADKPRSPDSQHPHTVRRAASRFQKAICDHKFPKLGDLAPGTLTISGGLASFPGDGKTAAELVDLADNMLLQSKRQGKNAITLGPAATEVCRLPEDEPE